jgi:outer membrane protein insertion porin family
LGGTTSVRGYDDGAIGSGKSFLQASAEYRFPIISIVGGTFFADYGTDLGTGNQVLGNPAGTRGKPGSGLGYGAGVRINSPLGALRLDFGLNNQGESRIQFGIGERF